jgi:hypothetical protein
MRSSLFIFHCCRDWRNSRVATTRTRLPASTGSLWVDRQTPRVRNQARTRIRTRKRTRWSRRGLQRGLGSVPSRTRARRRWTWVGNRTRRHWLCVCCEGRPDLHTRRALYIRMCMGRRLDNYQVSIRLRLYERRRCGVVQGSSHVIHTYR